MTFLLIGMLTALVTTPEMMKKTAEAMSKAKRGLFSRLRNAEPKVTAMVIAPRQGIAGWSVRIPCC